MSNNHHNQTHSRALLPTVTVREATAADAGALERLAQLDSGRVPTGPVLIAQVRGELHGAVSMLDGQTIADPFHPTAELVAMLRLRSGHTAALAPSPITALWRRGERDPRVPVPSAPSVPGMPNLPTRAA